MDDFGCSVCGSRALAYPSVLEDQEPVQCASCRAFVSTYGDLKQRAERVSGLARVPISGC
jgi:hypothetical protein